MTETSLTELSKKYKVILADPPWLFTTWSKRGKGRSPDKHYSCLSHDDICNLPIKEKSDKDCVLFMWTTWAHLCTQEPFDVIKSWGFECKTGGFVWKKLCPSGKAPHMGLGYYTRVDSEPCLLATKGKPPRVADMGIRQVLEAPVREHSRKPDEIYTLIERLYPQGPYLELFARQQRSGWDAWGNETTKFNKEI